MSGSLGSTLIGVAGGVIGFFIGGAPGAVVGFSLGFTVGGLFGTTNPTDTKPTNDFQIPTATEGSAVAVVFGERVINSPNIIYFGADGLHFEDISDDPGKGGGGVTSVSERRAFAPVHIALFGGSILETLVGVFDSKEQDWEQVNTDVGGAPIQISTGLGTDFGYKPPDGSSPIRGVTSIFSPNLYLGSNTTTMTALHVRVRARPSSTVGDPRAGLSTGVNPACVYWTILTSEESPITGQFWLGLPEATLNLASFQEAYEIFKAEDRGLNVLVEGDQPSVKEWIRALNDHTNSVLRTGSDGRLELYPLRSTNYTAVPVPESDVRDLQAGMATWGKVDSDFYATFPDAEKLFTSRQISGRNDAVIAMTGRRNVKTFNYEWFTDLRNVARRLAEIKEAFSFPNPQWAMVLSKKYHKLRVGDVISLTHRKFDYVNQKLRIQKIHDADLGKEGIAIECWIEPEPLTVDYVPPTPSGEAEVTSPAPAVPVEIVGLSTPWLHPYGPEPGPPGDPDGSGLGSPASGPPGSPNALSPILPAPGFPGYPLLLWAARAKGTDVGYLLGAAHSKEGDLPVNVLGNTPSSRWAHFFTTLDVIEANDWSYAGTKRLRVQFYPAYAGQAFPVQNQDDVDENGFLSRQEGSKWCLVVGNTEVWTWNRCVPLGGDVYEFVGCLRGGNKEYLYRWPAGTPAAVVDIRLPAMPGGLAYPDWAHRQRCIKQVDYDDPSVRARVRTFCQSMNHLAIHQGPSDGFGGSFGKTWLDRSAVARSATSFYKPANEIVCNRGPMPTCQAYRWGDGVEYRAWYSGAYGSFRDWLIEFPPFPDDVSGVGDRVAFDEVETIGEPFGPPHQPIGTRHEIGTDQPFDSFIGPCTGQTYRLFIMASSANPLTGTPVRTFDITLTGSEPFWSFFLYAESDQTSDGVDDTPNALWFWVAVQGVAGAWCRPRLVSKLGPYSAQVDPTYSISPT